MKVLFLTVAVSCTFLLAPDLSSAREEKKKTGGMSYEAARAECMRKMPNAYAQKLNRCIKNKMRNR